MHAFVETMSSRAPLSRHQCGRRGSRGVAVARIQLPAPPPAEVPGTRAPPVSRLCHAGRPACPVWATRRGQSRWEGCRRADASGGMGMLAAETGDQLVAENQMAPVTPIDALRRDGTTVAPFPGRCHAIYARCLDRGHE